MTLFLIAVAVVLTVSAICSLTEAALYAVGVSYVRHLADDDKPGGRLLMRFKENMELPISAILILNTAANTAGAAVAGAQARYLFGERSLIWFSACFTLAVLLFSEILPKVIGVAYNQRVSRVMSGPLNGLIKILSPLIWFTRIVSRLVKSEGSATTVSEQEVEQMAVISAEEGEIMPFEAELVKNVLRLNDVRARDIMTPRPVVFKLPSDMTLKEVSSRARNWTHSRIPVYNADDPETWIGVVLSRDVLAGLAKDEFGTALETLSKPIFFVSQDTPGHVLLQAFLKRRSHLFGVVDEFGGIAGVVTLEDVLESVLGEEIVDEIDSAVDMQEVARIRRRKQFGHRRGEDGD